MLFFFHRNVVFALESKHESWEVNMNNSSYQKKPSPRVLLWRPKTLPMFQACLTRANAINLHLTNIYRGRRLSKLPLGTNYCIPHGKKALECHALKYKTSTGSECCNTAPNFCLLQSGLGFFTGIALHRNTFLRCIRKVKAWREPFGSMGRAKAAPRFHAAPRSGLGALL